MLTPSSKAGIRAQIFDKSKGGWLMTFFAVKRDNSLHILNSISPAWTCSLKCLNLFTGIYGGLIGLKGKNLLVIGGAGLIGSHAVDKLLKEMLALL